MRLGFVGVLAVGISMMAGCGAAEVTVHSQDAQQLAQPVSLQAPGHCSIDYRTLLTASEAFWATYGTYPEAQSALVTAGLLRTASDDFELMVLDNDYAFVGVGDCAAFEPDESSLDPGVDEEPQEASVCAADRRTLETAIEAYTAYRGLPPDSEADLVNEGLMLHESSGWDLAGTGIVAVPGVCA